MTEVKAELLAGGTGLDIQPAVTPMSLLEVCVSRGGSIEELGKLMDLQLRWEANAAKKAFIEAMSAFKSDPPEILKNKRVAFGQTAYSHATLDNVCKAATEGLSKHGISHRWTIAQNGDSLIRVTCILTHVQGHSEETTLVAGADMSGAKNAIQGIASAVTYLERYTLLAATGLAAADIDNDGKGAQEWDKLQEFLDSISTSPNLKVLQDTFKAGFQEAVKLANTAAMKMLVDAKDARKLMLQKETNEPA